MTSTYIFIFAGESGPCTRDVDPLPTNEPDAIKAIYEFDDVEGVIRVDHDGVCKVNALADLANTAYTEWRERGNSIRNPDCVIPDWIERHSTIVPL